MKKHSINAATSDEKVRRVVIAVANWLCGVLEGSSRDSGDMTLADALDAWLRRQKLENQTLYTGCMVCGACGNSWENPVVSDDTIGIRCPQCGRSQSICPAPATARAQPPNIEALERVQQDVKDIIGRITELNRTIEVHNKTGETLR